MQLGLCEIQVLGLWKAWHQREPPVSSNLAATSHQSGAEASFIMQLLQNSKAIKKSTDFPCFSSFCSNCGSSAKKQSVMGSLSDVLGQSTMSSLRSSCTPCNTPPLLHRSAGSLQGSARTDTGDLMTSPYTTVFLFLF